MRVLLLIGFVSLLSGCETTIEIWDKGYPKSGSELKTEDAKREEFNKFAIYRGDVTGEHGVVQLQNDKDTNRFYTVGSFTPVIMKVSPDSKEKFETIRTINRWDYIPGFCALVGLLWNAKSKSEIAGRNVLLLGGVVGVVSLDYWKRSQSSAIIDDYHRDLNQMIFADKRQSSTESHRGISLNFSYHLDP